MEQDFLDEMIEESTKRNPEFPSLMEEARERRALLYEFENNALSSRMVVIYSPVDALNLPSPQ